MIHWDKYNKKYVVTIIFLSIIIGVFIADGNGVRTILSYNLFSHTYPQMALALHPNDSVLLEAIGHYYLNSGGYDIEKAKVAYTRAHAQSSTTMWAEYQLGRIAFVQGDFETAHSYFESALRKNPQNKRIIYARGVMYGFENKWQEAEKDFLEFIAWAPTEWGAYNDLAWVYAKQGKFEESLRVAEEGVARSIGGESNPWLWNAKGVALFNLNKYEGAYEAFSIALTQSQNVTHAEWVRAYSANDPAQAEIGLEDFKESLKTNIRKSRESIEWVDKSDSNN